MAVTDWSTTASANNAAPPTGAPEGMAPSSVNDVMRQMMADVRSFYDSTQTSISTLNTSVAALGPYAVKSATTARTSTTTSTADPDLSVSLSTGVYNGLIFLTASAASSGGLKFGCSFSGTFTSQPAVGRNNVSGFTWTGQDLLASGASGNVYLSTNALSSSLLIVETMVDVSVAGTLAVTWAQAASNAGATSLLRGSSMVFRKIA